MKRITYAVATLSFPDRPRAESWCLAKMAKGWRATLLTPAAAGGVLWRGVAEWRDQSTQR